MSNTSDVEDAIWALVDTLPGFRPSPTGLDVGRIPNRDGLFIVELLSGENVSGDANGDDVMTEDYPVTVYFFQLVNPRQQRASKRTANARKDGVRNALVAVNSLGDIDASVAYTDFNIDTDFIENHWLVSVGFVVTHTTTYE